MLSFIKGKIIHVHEQTITVYVDQLGLGFEVHASSKIRAIMDQIIELYLYLHWNQEQGPSLYGFASRPERECFVLLIGCPGIGPKLALSLLDQASIEELVSWIQSNDLKSLSALKGIGLKKAEQLILYLKNRLDDFILSPGKSTSAYAAQLKQVAQALESLNYSRCEVQQAIAHVNQQNSGHEPGFEVLMKHALAFLVKQT